MPLVDAHPHAWEMSQVGARRALVAARAPGPHEDTVVQAEDRMPDGGRWACTVLIEEVSTGGWTGTALSASEEPVTLRYRLDEGLTVERGR